VLEWEREWGFPFRGVGIGVRRRVHPALHLETVPCWCVGLIRLQLDPEQTNPVSK
jgi:hypothetical protein